MAITQQLAKLPTRQLQQPELPLKVDATYNLIICTHCYIGIPVDWVVAHLKNHHGLSSKLDDVMRALAVEKPCMSSVDAKLWLESTWVLAKAVKNIPVVSGLRC